MAKTLDYYRGLPYHRRHETFADDETGRLYYVASVEELAGCKVESDTVAGAYRALDELFDDYIEAKLERDSHIPEPAWQPAGPAQLLVTTPYIIEAVGLDGEPVNRNNSDDVDLGHRELQQA